jgi:hypothetical protein
MKINRRVLLIITASLGILIIVYSLVRHFTGIGLSEKLERYFLDMIIIAALGLFMYNRKLARDERIAREAAAREAEAAEARAAAGETEPEEEDESLPHWERRKSGGGD